MPPYLPIRALNRSAAVRINKQTIKATATSYVDLGATATQGQSVAKEVAYHSSIGQIYVVGPLTNNNTDVVVDYGGVCSAGSGSNISVTAGELLTRSTGVYVAIPASSNSPAVTNNASGNSRIDLAVSDNTTGVVTVVAGTPAASPVAPALPAGKTGLYTFTVVTGGGVPSLFVDVRPRP